MKERESKYVYPGTDVLINIPGIRDPEELQRYERIVTGERLAQLKLEPIKGSFDLEHLKEIHRYLFQDIYPFAGQIRDENIGKDFFSFAQVQFIEPAAQELFQQLKNDNFLKGSSLHQFAERAAHYMAEINVLHPFREGNGRTTREFIRQLGQVAGYELDWSKVDPERLLRASIRSTVDTKELANVIRDVARPLTNQERLAQFFDKAKPLLVKDLIKQVDGLPAGKSGMQLDPGTLNQEVLRYRVHKLENGSKLLRIKLKTEKSLEIQMDPAPCLPKEIKGQWIERAAKGIGPKLDRQMGLDFTK